MQPARGAPVGPGSMLGPFKLIQEIGAGGMGRVFRALDTVLQRPVAIKLISPEFLLGNKQAGERFIREARLTARIRHRNVVPVYHLGTDTNDNPFLVMELLQGRTLTAALEAKEHFPLSRIVTIVTQVLAALAAAHEHLVARSEAREHLLDPRGRRRGLRDRARLRRRQGAQRRGRRSHAQAEARDRNEKLLSAGDASRHR